MGSGKKRKRVCVNCGKESMHNSGTVAMKTPGFNLCPFCGAVTILSKSEIDAENERHEMLLQKIRNM